MADMTKTSTATMSVTSVIPLKVLADGAEISVPAYATDGTVYTIGDRCQVDVRTPQLPTVTGKVVVSP